MEVASPERVYSDNRATNLCGQRTKIVQQTQARNSVEACRECRHLISFYFCGRWADLSCDVMEERERAGDNVGHEGPSCLEVDSRKRLCTIQPLRTNCYKLWLEMPSHLGPIRSKPVYLTPNDHGERWNQQLGLILLKWLPLCLLTCFWVCNHSFLGWNCCVIDCSQ